MSKVKKVKKAIIPAAGLGTRFLPATASLPKEMLPVVDKPMIQYAVEEAKEAGIEEFIIITGRGKQTIENHFDVAYELEKTLVERGKRTALDLLQRQLPKPGQVVFTRQQRPLGLGHAVWCARNFIGNEPFALLLPDDLLYGKPSVLSQMMKAYEKVGGNICAVTEVPIEQTYKYGVLDIEKREGKLIKTKAVVEKPASSDAPSNITIVGRYILQPEIMDDLGKMNRGQGGEIQLTDSIETLIENGIPLHGLLYDGERYDCGGPRGFLEANIQMAAKREELSGFVQDLVTRVQKKYK
ncbi:MAG: UTP--glucose-1-phosphate uridylyltransferase GalU [Alphaproteobacteria bacterium]